ncbi:MAG TPA: hypothetical protein VM120_06495 [Bryobacteraceae bacterium]|nr:hypothetical protein [Bryobacteraceae bacterium]
MSLRLFWAIAALLVLGLILYYRTQHSSLRVEPHAAEQIEKAKQR